MFSLLSKNLNYDYYCDVNIITTYSANPFMGCLGTTRLAGYLGEPPGIKSSISNVYQKVESGVHTKTCWNKHPCVYMSRLIPWSFTIIISHWLWQKLWSVHIYMEAIASIACVWIKRHPSFWDDSAHVRDHGLWQMEWGLDFGHHSCAQPYVSV